MELLAAVGDVNDLGGVPVREAVLQRGKIGSGVVEAAVAFADQGWRVFELRIAFEKNRHGSFAFTSDAFSLEFADDALQMRIVETFAERVVEGDAEAFV